MRGFLGALLFLCAAFPALASNDNIKPMEFPKDYPVGAKIFKTGSCKDTNATLVQYERSPMNIMLMIKFAKTAYYDVVNKEGSYYFISEDSTVGEFVPQQVTHKEWDDRLKAESNSMFLLAHKNKGILDNKTCSFSYPTPIKLNPKETPA